MTKEEIRKLLDDYHECYEGLRMESGSGEYIREHMDKIVDKLFLHSKEERELLDTESAQSSENLPTPQHKEMGNE